jgi:hypothetical protein
MDWLGVLAQAGWRGMERGVVMVLMGLLGGFLEGFKGFDSCGARRFGRGQGVDFAGLGMVVEGERAGGSRNGGYEERSFCHTREQLLKAMSSGGRGRLTFIFLSLQVLCA